MARAREKRKEGQALDGFRFVLGSCWVGAQRWYLEFCDGEVEASFRKRIHGGAPLEMGRTIWYGQDNLIRINAELLLARDFQEIVNTVIHELGHVALEGRYTLLEGHTESKVEHILHALDELLGQGLATLGMISPDFYKICEQAKAAYIEYLNSKKKILKNLQDAILSIGS